MKDFIWRKYVSIGLALSFALITISGIILYIAPPGSIARWVKWIMIGLDRAQWETLHTIFSFLFIAFGIVHLFNLNWKLFISYFTNGFVNHVRSRKEITAALATIIIIFLLTVFKLPPVYSLMELGNRISDTWAENIGRPPVAGIEDLKLNELADMFFASDISRIERLLEDSDYDIPGTESSLKEIAAHNGVSPMEIFKALKTDPSDSYSR